MFTDDIKKYISIIENPENIYSNTSYKRIIKENKSSSLLQNIKEVEGYHFKSNILLETICRDLNTNQKYIVEGIYNEFRPLIEATLTPSQVGELFQNIEAASTVNRTAIGKTKDIIVKANEIINKAGKWIQDTTPVQAFDQKFEKLKKDISTKFPDSKIVNGISKIGAYAKENPGKTAVVIGILTAIASLAAGPLGGAIAGQILRGTFELFKGEKLSTAIGKGAKTAAIGALAGMSFKYLSDAIVDTIRNATAEDIWNQIKSFDKAATEDALAGVNAKYRGLLDQLEGARTWKQSGTINRFGYNYDLILTRDQYEKVTQMQKEISRMKDFSPNWFNSTAKYHEFMRGLQDNPIQSKYRAALAALEVAQNTNASIEQLQKVGIFDKLDNLSAFVDKAKKINSAMASAAQGAINASLKLKKNIKKESIDQRPYIKKLNISQVKTIIEICQNNSDSLKEGPFDSLKNVVSSIGTKAAKFGKNLTTKVTADKLTKAWIDAGRPTEEDKIISILKRMGVHDETIKIAFSSVKPIDNSSKPIEVNTPTTNSSSKSSTSSESDRNLTTRQDLEKIRNNIFATLK